MNGNRGYDWPAHIKEAALRMIADGWTAQQVEAEMGVPDATVTYWRRQAEGAPVSQLAAEPIPAVWDRVQREAAQAASESLARLDRAQPDAARAIAAIGRLAHDAYLDHTVGRRGSVQIDARQQIIGLDGVLEALAQARALLSAPAQSMDATDLVVEVEHGEATDARGVGSGTAEAE